jgi:hypothetical protein
MKLLTPYFLYRQNYVFTEGQQYFTINLTFIEKKNDKYYFKSKESAEKQFPFDSAPPPNHYVVTDETGKNIVMKYESESFAKNKYIYTFSFVEIVGDIIQNYKPFLTHYPPSTKNKFLRDSRVHPSKGHQASFRTNALNPSKALKKKGGTRRKKKTHQHSSRYYFNSQYPL